METILVILTVLVSVLLIVIVLIQKSKGGGLSSTFAGSNQIMGVRRTTDFVEKATWTLSIVIMVLAIAATLVTTANGSKSNHKTNDVQPLEVAQPAPVANYDTPAAAGEVVAVDETVVAEEAGN